MINWPELFVGAALNSVIQAGQNARRRHQQRRDIPQHVATRLQALLGSPGQVTYIMAALAEAIGPRSWTDLRSVTELQTLVAGALPAPRGQFHGLQAERELVAAVIYEAIQIAEATSGAQRLSSSLEQGNHLAQLAPSLNQVMQDYRDRQRQPLRRATQDIAEIALAAGQRQLKLTVGADGEVTAHDVKLNLHLEGDNALRMLGWLHGGVDMPRTLHLTPDHGVIGLSTGHAALDDLLHVQSAPTGLVLQKPVHTSKVRCKVTQGATARHVDAAVEYDADTRTLTLHLGPEGLRISVQAEFRPDTAAPALQVQWTIEDEGRVLPEEAVRWLDVFLLLLQDGARLAITEVTLPSCERQVRPEPADLLRVRGTDQLGQLASLVRFHRAMIRVARIIEDAGHDAAHLPLPDTVDEWDAVVLNHLDQLLQGKGQVPVSGEVTTADPEMIAHLRMTQIPDSLVQTTRFRTGPYEVVAVQLLQGLEAQELAPVEGEVRFGITAVAGPPEFHVNGVAVDA